MLEGAAGSGRRLTACADANVVYTHYDVNPFMHAAGWRTDAEDKVTQVSVMDCDGAPLVGAGAFESPLQLRMTASGGVPDTSGAESYLAYCLRIESDANGTDVWSPRGLSASFDTTFGNDTLVFHTPYSEGSYVVGFEQVFKSCDLADVHGGLELRGEPSTTAQDQTPYWTCDSDPTTLQFGCQASSAPSKTDPDMCYRITPEATGFKCTNSNFLRQTTMSERCATAMLSASEATCSGSIFWIGADGDCQCASDDCGPLSRTEDADAAIFRFEAQASELVMDRWHMPDQLVASVDGDVVFGETDFPPTAVLHDDEDSWRATVDFTTTATIELSFFSDYWVDGLRLRQPPLDASPMNEFTVEYR